MLTVQECTQIVIKLLPGLGLCLSLLSIAASIRSRDFVATCTVISRLGASIGVVFALFHVAFALTYTDVRFAASDTIRKGQYGVTRNPNASYQ